MGDGWFKCGEGRWRDGQGYRLRAAGICISTDNTLLLVTSRRHPDVWVVPGGGIEDNESSLAAAQRELAEEAGVTSTPLAHIATFVDETRRHKTDVFLLRLGVMSSVWEEMETLGRQRRLFSREEALLVLKQSQRHYLDELPRSLLYTKAVTPLPLDRLIITLWPCACIHKEGHENCTKPIQFTEKKTKMKINDEPS